MNASQVTRTVPLIMIGGTEDPVRLGLAESFARPGGNVTGFLLTADQEILGKKFQLLRDAAPGISRVGVIANPDSAGDAAELRMVPSVAEGSGWDIVFSRSGRRANWTQRWRRQRVMTCRRSMCPGPLF
jgi:putative tryptophan/tyrosine transport system substrate-binding protein